MTIAELGALVVLSCWCLAMLGLFAILMFRK